MEKLAIITGASSGIGAALARDLAGRGVPVGLVARRVERMSALADEIAAAGGKAAFAQADVTDFDGLKAAFAGLEQELGPCGTLIANAGILLVSTSHHNKPERVLAQMRVNFDGVVHSIHAVLPGMLERQSGRICAVSSIAGFRGIGNWAGYSATKAAVNALMESYRIELKGEGITCTTLCPGYVASELTEDFAGPMPFLLPADRAARQMADALLRGESQYVLPWQMAGAMGVARVLPNWMWDRIQRRGVRRWRAQKGPDSGQSAKRG